MYCNFDSNNRNTNANRKYRMQDGAYKSNISLGIKSLRKSFNIFFEYNVKEKNIKKTQYFGTYGIVSFKSPVDFFAGIVDMKINLQVNHLVRYSNNKTGFIIKNNHDKKIPTIQSRIFSKYNGTICGIPFRTIGNKNNFIFDRDMILELLAVLLKDHHILYFLFNKEHKIITFYLMVKDERQHISKNKILKFDFKKDRDLVNVVLYDGDYQSIPKKNGFIFTQNLSILQGAHIIQGPFSNTEIFFTFSNNQVALYFCNISQLQIQDIYNVTS